MPISLAGSLNTTALVVPDLYVQIVPPALLSLNGVPSNRVGVVGTATWGPKNTPTVVGNYAQYVSSFGPLVARKYDAGTYFAIMTQNGAADARMVRVTDGTDASATATGVATCISYAALYTGSLGNLVTVTRSVGTQANSWKLVIGIPGQVPEVFDNIVGSGNSYWINEANVINNGNTFRGPSNYVLSTAGVGITAPGAGTYTLAGGTDGATLTNAIPLIGVDGFPKTGMYSLRAQGCSVLVVVDDDNASDFTTIDGFVQTEAMIAIYAYPMSGNVSNALTMTSSAAVDSWTSYPLFGDYLYWADPVTKVTRLVNPSAFMAARVANLAPNQSPGGKQLFGIVGSQRLGTPGTQQLNYYSTAELTAIIGARLEVVTTPSPVGFIWAARVGHNASSNASINGVNYSRMTNYIASTLNAGMGQYVFQVVTPALFKNIKATLVNFLSNLLGQNLLSLQPDGSMPFTVVCDNSNNPQSRTSLGYVQADIAVVYQAINEKFIINVQGGTTVVLATNSGISLTTTA
jgi:hypothetical protein